MASTPQKDDQEIADLLDALADLLVVVWEEEQLTKDSKNEDR